MGSEMCIRDRIVGRALYDGRVDLAESIQAIGAGRLQDVTLMSSDLA